MDFPLIYCNGDSYSNPKYHTSLIGNTYDHIVGDHFGGFVMNKAINGSSNRRIIRTSLHDLIQQKKLNPTQKVIVLIGLTFEMRSELWNNDTIPHNSEESNFETFRFSSDLNWREKLLSGKSINEFDNKFLKKYADGKAYFYNPYAERINLFTDLIMFVNSLQTMNMKYIIFQAPPIEPLEKEYLVDFFKNELYNDSGIINFDDFSFLEWASNQFIPLDFKDNPTIGHYGADAHNAFANEIIMPKLENMV